MEIYRADRDPNNPNSLIDLDDIRGELQTFNHPVTQESLIKYITQFNLNDLLLRIGQTTRHLFNINKQTDAACLYTNSRLSYLATLSIVHGSNFSSREVSKPEFERLVLMLNRYHTDLFFDDKKSIKADDMEIFINQLMFFDNLFNIKIAYLQSRNEIIFNQLANKAHLKPSFDLEGAFRALTKVGSEDYRDIGIAISGCFLNHDILKKPYFDFSDTERTETFNNFLNKNSISIEEFRKKYSDSPFELPPFLETPLIRINASGDLICPHIPALIMRCSDIYHFLYTDLKRKFSDWYGLIFEDYVGHLLGQFFEKDQIFSEITYATKETKNNKTVDWIVREGKTIILIECKNKRVHINKSITNGDLKQFQIDVEQAIGEGVLQLHKTATLIREKKEPKLKVFSDAKEIIQIILLYNFENSNSRGVRRRVQNFLQDKHGIDCNDDYQVMDIEELERILPYRDFSRNRLLRNLIKNKIANKKYRWRSFMTYLYHEYGKKLPENKFLKNTLDSIYERSKRKFIDNLKDK